jgi:hypothetical protein
MVVGYQGENRRGFSSHPTRDRVASTATSGCYAAYLSGMVGRQGSLVAAVSHMAGAVAG